MRRYTRPSGWCTACSTGRNLSRLVQIAGDVVHAAARGTVCVGRLGTGACRPGSGMGPSQEAWERVASRRRRAWGSPLGGVSTPPDGSRRSPSWPPVRAELRERRPADRPPPSDDSGRSRAWTGFRPTLDRAGGSVLGPEAEFVHRVAFTDPSSVGSLPLKGPPAG